MARGSFLAAPAHSISVWYSSSRSFLTSVIQFQYSRPPPAYNEFLQMPFWFGVLPSPTAPPGWDIMYARQSLLLEDEKFDDLLSWNQFKPRRQSHLICWNISPLTPWNCHRMSPGVQGVWSQEGGRSLQQGWKVESLNWCSAAPLGRDYPVCQMCPECTFSNFIFRSM